MLEIFLTNSCLLTLLFNSFSMVGKLFSASAIKHFFVADGVSDRLTLPLRLLEVVSLEYPIFAALAKPPALPAATFFGFFESLEPLPPDKMILQILIMIEDVKC